MSLQEHGLLGESPALVALQEAVARLLPAAMAPRPTPILILGETGTGKGVLARALHDGSGRRARPFVDVNSAAIPGSLFEAELLGVAAGAFTDAREPRSGLVQAADGGTLFLDEIGEMPQPLQAKLLHVIEARTVRRLGSTRAEAVDVWILAASSRDLSVAARSGLFREDLYHRLAAVTLHLAPLRERGRDVILLAERFLARACADHGLPAKTLTPDARVALAAHSWPGNVRELGNLIERATLLGDGLRMTAAMLGLAVPTRVGTLASPTAVSGLEAAVGQLERTRLVEALRRRGGNVAGAARDLGLTRNKLRQRIAKYGLERPDSAAEERPRSAAVRPPVRPGRATPSSALRWEVRQVAFLRAVLGAPPTASESNSTVDSRLLEALLDRIEGFGGRILELGPRRLVAGFGIEPIEDASARAALAALAMRRAGEGEQKAEPGRPGLGLSVHLGTPRVCLLDDGPRLDPESWSADRAALASLGSDDPGAILVTEAAARTLGRRFDLWPCDRLGDGGARRFRLVGPRFGFGPGGRITPHVGRRDALDVLEARFGDVVAGRGAVVAVVGEPGIGKSRLLFEFRRGLESRAVHVLEGRCLSHASTTPGLPLIELLRNHAGILDGEGAAPAVAKLDACAQAAGLGPVAISCLHHFLGFAGAAERVGGLAPEVVRARTAEAVRDLLLRSSRAGPIVVMIEDLHWIDTVSEQFLGRLVEGLASAPILLLPTFRPGYRAAWLDRSYVSRVALGPLSSEASVAVMRSVLDGMSVSEAMIRTIVARAEGNPFFIEELTRSLRDGGEAGARESVPETVQAVLGARIARLPAPSRALLEAAAVVGRDVPLTLLARVAGLSPAVLGRHLRALVAAEFLQEVDGDPEALYTFKHALTHDTAYEGLAPEARRAFHARAALALEQASEDGESGPSESLVDHTFRAGLWEKAADYCRRAGIRAARRSANREATVRFMQALESLRHGPRSTATLATEVDVLVDLRNARFALGEADEAFRILREAERIAETLGDPRRRALVAAWSSGHWWAAGEPERALATARQGLTLATEVGDPGLLLTARHMLARFSFTLGDYRGASALHRAAMAPFEETTLEPDLARVSVASRGWLAAALAELGEFDEARGHAEEALRRADVLEFPLGQIIACFALGVTWLACGRPESAIPALERGRRLAGTWSVGMLVNELTSHLGQAYAAMGRLPEALPLLEGVLSEDVSIAVLSYQAIRLVFLGELYGRLGRLDEARAVAGRALDHARARRQRGIEAWALRLMAHLATAAGPPENSEPPGLPEARILFRRALDLATELGMRPLEAYCHHDLAILGRGPGDAEDVSHRARARILFREMGMRAPTTRALAEATSTTAAPGRVH